MGVEEEAVAAAEVDRLSAQCGRGGGDGAGEVGVDHQLDVGDPGGDSDDRVVGGDEVLHALLGRLGPEVIERDGVCGAVEAPHPVVGGRAVAGLLFGLDLVAEDARGAEPDLVVLRVGPQDDRGPCGAGVAGWPGGPGLPSAGGRRFEVAAVGESVVVVVDVHLHR